MAEREQRLLIADDDDDELGILLTRLRGLGRGRVFTAGDGLRTLDMLRRHAPDVLMLDMIMPGMDGLGVMTHIRELQLPRLPHIVALIEPGQEALGQRALALGAGLVLDKGRMPEDMAGVLASALGAPRRGLLGGPELERQIYAALIEVGIARRLDGFGYLIEAISLALEDVDYQNNLSKRLYPAVAQKYNTSAACVERSIRHAVETAWSRSRLSVLQREFGNTIDSDRGKPTNAEFIARMADKMRSGGAYPPGGE